MKPFGKSIIAIALGLAVTSMSTSAFAATCPVKNVVNQGQWLPYFMNSQPSQQSQPSNQWNWAFPSNSMQWVELPMQQPVQKPVQQPVQKPVQKPVQQPAKAPASNTVNASSQFAREVANLVNQERAKAGLAPLAYDAALEKVALAKAADMDQNNYFDHNSPTYGSPFDMMKRFGVSYMTAGENIAMGQRSAEEVMQQWMNSDGHRKNIMNPNFTKIGVGYQNGYWVQEFTG
ncbi:CAP domain-containing protein [Brevibacillus borstelensis]|uniref:CAP domain-containing protein n=1 Tax=Brevibacillus borstelensis TaxID=45462 RepID=UPI002E2121E5|nr:CAP domain-containing protein [Brevibacillus borstelensis]